MSKTNKPVETFELYTKDMLVKMAIVIPVITASLMIFPFFTNGDILAVAIFALFTSVLLFIIMYFAVYKRYEKFATIDDYSLRILENEQSKSTPIEDIKILNADEVVGKKCAVVRMETGKIYLDDNVSILVKIFFFGLILIVDGIIKKLFSAQKKTCLETKSIRT